MNKPFVPIAALLGAVGAAAGVTLGQVAGFWPGALLAVLAGALTCAGAALASFWLATRQLGSRIDALTALGQGTSAGASTNGSASALKAPSAGWQALDQRLGRLGQVLERLVRVQAEFDEVEQIARGLWRASNGSTNGSAATTAAGDGNGEVRQGILALLSEVRTTADRVVEDSNALEETAEQIATGALDQSESVARATSTVETLSGKIDEISHNAEAAADAGQRAREEARHGLEEVQRLIEGIDRLRAHVESNGRKVRRLGDRSVEIGTIVDLIDGISGRTDMLALNATIESVRAGEHGRGFAVVAEEIRKLAERTAAATREIGTLVEAIQADTHESIAALGEEQAEVEQEAQRVREAGAALERIGEVAERSARLVEGISHSANDQVLSTHELVRAVQRISEVTQQTLSGYARAREHVRLLAQRCDRLHKLSAVPGPRVPHLPTNGAHARWSNPLEPSP